MKTITIQKIKKWMLPMSLAGILIVLLCLATHASAQRRGGGGRSFSRGGGGFQSGAGFRSGGGSVRFSNYQNYSRPSYDRFSRENTNRNTSRNQYRDNQVNNRRDGFQPGLENRREGQQDRRDFRGEGNQNRAEASRTRVSQRPSGGWKGGKKEVEGKYQGQHYRGYYQRNQYNHWSDAHRDWNRYCQNHHWLPPGTTINIRPRYYCNVFVGGRPYYYWGGLYYRPYNNRYVIVTPPIGAVVYALPEPTTIVYAGTTPYYYVDGAYYTATDEPANLPVENPDYAAADSDNDDNAGNGNGGTADSSEMLESDDHNFKVVATPIGATVPYLPKNAKKETINNKTYYVVTGGEDAKTYYRAFASAGDTIYMVVEDPNKA